jgi:hypothetical protein
MGLVLFFQRGFAVFASVIMINAIVKKNKSPESQDVIFKITSRVHSKK